MAGGPVWGAERAGLNVTLLEWPAGQGPPEQVNELRYLTAHVRRGGLQLKRF